MDRLCILCHKIQPNEAFGGKGERAHIAISSNERPARCSATIWQRNSGVYLGCDFAILDPFFCEHEVTTMPGQVQPSGSHALSVGEKHCLRETQ